MLGRLFDGVGLHGYGTCQLTAPSTLPSTLITQPIWYAFYNFVFFLGFLHLQHGDSNIAFSVLTVCFPLERSVGWYTQVPVCTCGHTGTTACKACSPARHQLLQALEVSQAGSSGLSL